LGTDVDRLGTHTSIHLNVFIREPCAEFRDLGNAALDEFLPATSWERTFPIQSAVMKFSGKQNIPGYTVMTRSISASSPTSSDIEVDGVSGDIATPAFIFRSWMECIREMGSAAMDNMVSMRGSVASQGGGVRLTCSLDMEAVERSSSVCNVIHPLIYGRALVSGFQM
jgi:hypothetical protein